MCDPIYYLHQCRELLALIAINVWLILGIFIISYPILGNILRIKYIKK
jgi:hypothetical protein